MANPLNFASNSRVAFITNGVSAEGEVSYRLIVIRNKGADVDARRLSPR
jgi:hypothetical protein